MTRTLFALLMVLMLIGRLATATQMIDLAPQASVRGTRVQLRDIARYPDRLPSGWGDRDIAAAPSPSETRSLSLSAIAAALHPYDDMRDVVLRGRPHVTVTSRTQSLDVKRLDEALDAYLEKTTAPAERRFRVCGDSLELPVLPDGELQVRVLRIREDAGRNGNRDSWAVVALQVDGHPVTEAPLDVKLIELQPFWAARRPLTRGTTLTLEDLQTVWLEPRDATHYFAAENPVDGMELRRNVSTGQRLSPGMLAAPMVVRRGETLRVVATYGGLTVTLRARALSDGRMDEQIACLNERSGRRMHVRVVGPREAVLDTAQEARS